MTDDYIELRRQLDIISNEVSNIKADVARTRESLGNVISKSADEFERVEKVLDEHKENIDNIKEKINEIEKCKARRKNIDPDTELKNYFWTRSARKFTDVAKSTALKIIIGAIVIGILIALGIKYIPNLPI